MFQFRQIQPRFFYFLVLGVAVFAQLGRAELDSSEIRAEAPEASASAFRAQLRIGYAQTESAWSTVNKFNSLGRDLKKVNEFLNRKYGVREEIFSSALLAFDGIPIAKELLFPSAYFSVAGEALGTALVQNPVVPQLKSKLISIGMLQSGLQLRKLEGYPDMKFGGLWGSGTETNLTGYSTDLIEGIPKSRRKITVWGWRAELAQRKYFAGNYSLGYEARILGLHLPLDEERKTQLSVRTSPWFYSWKAGISPTRKKLSFPLLGASELSVDGILGPQPFPVDFLPVIWPYAHEASAFPELGAMLGLGLRLENTMGSWLRSSFRLGFFGGYPGASLELNGAGVYLLAGTWGIEDSSAYRVRGYRIWHAAIGGRF